MSTVRVAAARVLMALDRGQTTLAAEVDRARRGLHDERDRGLLLELTSGVCRWRAELDACLEPCSQRPLAEMDSGIRATLRLALYQLRHLDRIPEHAVVHESVEAARELGSPRAAGFVNAILRAYLRHADAVALPPRPGAGATRRQHLAYLSVTLSHPRWLVARWLDRYGFDATERWCQFNNATPDVTVRARSADADALTVLEDAGVTAARGLFAAEVARLSPGVLGSLSPDLRKELVVQDEGSIVVAHAAGAKPDDRVLDLCASPGGKTVVLWGDMQNRGCLVACDARPHRIQILRETLTDADVPVRVIQLDATQPLPFGATFDLVFVDAPCSGTGTLRRDPDAKWTVSLEALPALVDAQRQILARAAAAVRPGGTLVYATCASEPDENDAVVDAFLASTPAFEERPLQGPLVDAGGRLRTLPPRDSLDAFFAAQLVRRESA
jgi:16S rRNA (cytosine967-C5)-methyltransferase